MGTLWQDLRFGLRMLVKNPGFTLVAVLTLALGIGANTAIFSAVNTILLRPLSFKDSQQLVQVWGTSSDFPGFRLTISPAEYAGIKSQIRSFGGMALYQPGSMNLTGQGEPEQVMTAAIEGSFFRTHDASVARGRAFLDEEEVPGKDQEVVLSDALWRRRFGADPAILGKTISLDGESFTVVGTLSHEFRFPVPYDVYKPLAFTDAQRSNLDNHTCLLLARLASKATLQQAQVELATIAARLTKAYPKDEEGLGLEAITLQEGLVGGTRALLLVLLAAVGFVLLIACANVANLSLARNWKRQREMTIRAALGATRTRLIRQLLVESMALAALGGAAGLLLGTWGVDVLRAFAPAGTPRLDEIGLNRSMLWFTLAISAAVGILFGLAPALQASRADSSAALKEGGSVSASGFGSKGRHRLRGLLVVAEVALAVVLLAGGALTLRSFAKLVRVDPGYRADHVLTLTVPLPEAKYPQKEEQRAFFEDLQQRASRLPGAKHAALMAMPLLTGMVRTGDLQIEGIPKLDMAAGTIFEVHNVSPGYFETLGIRLLEGRAFREQDRPGNLPVAIVNETLARHYWHAHEAIGKRLSVDRDKNGKPEWREIIGVASDTRTINLAHPAGPQIYVPFSQDATPEMTLVVRTQTDPMALAGAVRDQVWSLDRDQPITKMQTLEQAVSVSVAEPRFRTLLLGAFAGLGLALTLVGIYGVISYSVSQRTHEIGIRVALGASPREILRLVVVEGMRLVIAGAGIGLVAAFVLTRFINKMLFEVKANDPLTFAGVILLLGCVSVAACWIPARRATKVDPMIALRYE